jgi:hypothetical protein
VSAAAAGLSAGVRRGCGRLAARAQALDLLRGASRAEE